MVRSRVTRVIALLVLILAQAALVLPHRMMAETATASAQAAGTMAHESCHDSAATHQDGGALPASHSRTPMPPCGSCPAPMPGTGCAQMLSCGPGSGFPTTASLALLPTVATTESVPPGSAPAAHDFIPDPPPPRA